LSAFEDMSDVVGLLSTGTYVVTRPGATAYVNGVRTVGTPTVFSIDAHIQPLTGLQLDRQPDGFRNSEKLVCFTVVELRTVDAAEPDTVTVFGLAHQVESVQRWSNLGNFYRAILVRPAK
jgi:hypothetical protein